jgi:hypothetical protein
MEKTLTEHLYRSSTASAPVRSVKQKVKDTGITIELFSLSAEESKTVAVLHDNRMDRRIRHCHGRGRGDGWRRERRPAAR